MQTDPSQYHLVIDSDIAFKPDAVPVTTLLFIRVWDVFKSGPSLVSFCFLSS